MNKHISHMTRGALTIAAMLALAGCAESGGAETNKSAVTQPPQVRGSTPAKPGDARTASPSRPMPGTGSTKQPSPSNAAKTAGAKQPGTSSPQASSGSKSAPTGKDLSKQAPKPASGTRAEKSEPQKTSAQKAAPQKIATNEPKSSPRASAGTPATAVGPNSNARSEPLPPKERARVAPSPPPREQPATQPQQPPPQPSAQPAATAAPSPIPPVSGRPIEEGLVPPARSVPAVPPIAGRPTDEPAGAASRPGPSASTAPAPASTGSSAAGFDGASYSVFADAQNTRARRLQRIWARAVASITFVDDEGNQRWEQGEGHFQVIQPSKMALSVGKLGETFLWLGCDEDRYWFIDPKETRRAYVGRHELVTRRKIESLGLPVAPRDLIALSGITLVATTPERDTTFAPGTAGELVCEQPRAGSLWRTRIDSARMVPSGIDIFDAGGRHTIAAELDSYNEVRIRGEAGNFPQMPSRMKLTHLPTNSSMSLSLSDATDGGRGRLAADVFNFESLVERLGITEVVDLDQGD